MKGSHKDKAVRVNITFEVNNRYSAFGVYTTYIVNPVATREQDKQKLADTTQTPNLDKRQKKFIGQEFETWCVLYVFCYSLHEKAETFYCYFTG